MTDEEKRERYEQLRKQQENEWPRMTDEKKRIGQAVQVVVPSTVCIFYSIDCINRKRRLR